MVFVFKGENDKLGGMKTLILQRTIPHYRKPLFDKLLATGRFGLVTAANFPQGRSPVKSVALAGVAEENFWFPRPQNPFFCYVPLVKIWRKYKPETFILEAGTTMTSTWLALLWTRLPRRRRPKIVFWMHGKPVGAAKGGWKSRLARMVKQWQVRWADGVLTYTSEDKAYLRTLAGTNATPIVATNNTVDITPMLALRQAASIVKTDAPVWLAVGRLTADKKVDEVVRLFQQFVRSHPQAQLYIIGEGEEQAALAALAGPLLDKQIHLVGAVYEEAELARYFNAADVFMLAGAAGLGVNHALAYGVPVLAYAEDADGAGPYHHPEIAYVEDGVTGWRVAPYTFDAMLDKVLALFADGMRPRALLAETLPTYAEKNLSLDRMVVAFEEI